MRFPFATLLLPLLLAGSPLFAQTIIFEPVQTREPPLADEQPIRQSGGYDPDETSEVRPAQYVVPLGSATTPGALPGELLTSPSIVPIGYTETPGTLPTPQVTLDVEGSEVSSTGQTVVYKLIIKNVSRAKAHNVVVKVIPPKNVAKVKADPPPTHDEAETRWEMKILEPGQSKTIELAYKPEANVEEVKIQARVQFDFGRGMVTKVTPPMLSVKKDGPEQIVVGDIVNYRITVANTGKVTIRDIEIKEMLNKGLEYDDREIARGAVDGRLMSSIDRKNGERTWTGLTLAPGQTRTLEYRVKALAPGRIGSTVLVNAPGDVKKDTGLDVEVLTAQLQVKAEGPSAKTTVGQPAVFRVTVDNRGSADLRNVVVRALFPPDMRVVRATNGGQPARDSVQWTVADLKRGDLKEFSVSLETKSPGNRTVQFSARADKGQVQKSEVKVEFAGTSNLDWDVEAPAMGTIGKVMIYRVTVANRGTATGRARVRVDLPPALDKNSTTPSSGDVMGSQGSQTKGFRFDEVDVPAGKKTTYVIRLDPHSAGEAKAIFWLEEPGREPKREDKVSNVTATDTRSPSGPPPARGVDTSKVGSSPRD